tara:strand:+ start:166 stop:600 length:435 start_codon:yes stop_codon:yes gene_type:complete
MTDFNYGVYHNDTLNNAIDKCRDGIAERKQLIKDFTKILNNPKGYSKKKLDGLAYRVENAKCLIKILGEEIIEIQEELAKREAEVYGFLDLSRPLAKIREANEEIEADENLTECEKDKMLFFNAFEYKERCGRIKELRSIQGRL